MEQKRCHAAKIRSLIHNFVGMRYKYLSTFSFRIEKVDSFLVHTSKVPKDDTLFLRTVVVILTDVAHIWSNMSSQSQT